MIQIIREWNSFPKCVLYFTNMTECNYANCYCLSLKLHLLFRIGLFKLCPRLLLQFFSIFRLYWYIVLLLRMVFLKLSPLLFFSSGGAPDQLLLGRQQQPHRAPWPQPALPGAVPHRRGAVQRLVQPAVPLVQRSPLRPSGFALLPSPWPKRRCAYQFSGVHQWPWYVE